MVKIKQKKTMNLPQLIEYIEQTDYEACVYQADDAPVYVRVGRIKGIHIEGSGTVFPHNTFTIEVEEEITEDTELFLVERFTDSEGIICYQRHRKQSIKNNIKNNPSYFKTTHIYTEVNEELVLIWTCEKGLVD